MWGCISELRRVREDFLLLICFPPRLKVAGLAAPHSVQSESLHSFPSGTLT